MNKKIMTLLLLGSLLTLLVSGCSPAKQPGTTSNTAIKQQEVLTVAAAADLTKAFAEVGTAFEKQNNCKVKFTFGSTGTALEQIINGAPYDVFAAASVSAIEDLKQREMIFPDTQTLYAIGRIGIATKLGSKLQVIELQDLLKPEIKKIAIANPEHAPYGQAAKQALESAGIWEQVKDKLVYGKSIQEALTFLNTGNADAGIIALSLYNKEQVNFTLVDDQLHKPLKQALAVIRETKHEELARSFIQFVNSKEGSAIMRKYGFKLPSEMK